MYIVSGALFVLPNNIGDYWSESPDLVKVLNERGEGIREKHILSNYCMEWRDGGVISFMNTGPPICLTVYKE